MRDESINLGIAIKKARINKHLTQAQLAEILDVSIRHIQGIENEGKKSKF